MANQKNLLLLLDRPQEPVFMEKRHSGTSESTFFDVPDNVMTKRYFPICKRLNSANDIETKTIIQVKEMPLPDISLAMSVDRNEPFSFFIPMHRRAAGCLIDTFNGEFIHYCKCCVVYWN